jgi:signal transduction histidine kinase
MQNASMSDSSSEKEAPLLSQAAHEVRNSLAVALGYTRFVLRDKKVTVADQHREWLETALRACGRLADLANDMSDFAKLESGEERLVRTATDLRTLLAAAISALPASEPIDIELSTGQAPAIVDADGSKLRTALVAVIVALSKAVPDKKLLVEERSREDGGRRVSWIVIGDVEQVNDLRHATADSLRWFNRSVGNTGLSLWRAAWVVDAHGGSMWSSVDKTKPATVIMLPLRS